MEIEELIKSFYQSMGRRIKSTREIRNMSPEELGQCLIPPRPKQEIIEIEKSLLVFPCDELNRFAAVLGVPVCYLIGSSALSEWIHDEQLVNDYYQLNEHSRRSVRKLAFELNGGNPIVFN